MEARECRKFDLNRNMAIGENIDSRILKTTYLQRFLSNIFFANQLSMK